MYKQVEEQIHYDEFVQAKADHWVSILNLKSGLMYSFEEENLHSVNIFLNPITADISMHFHGLVNTENNPNLFWQYIITYHIFIVFVVTKPRSRG